MQTKHTVTVYTYPTAVTLDRLVRAAARRDGLEGQVRIIRMRPRSTDQGIRQMIDVDIEVGR